MNLVNALSDFNVNLCEDNKEMIQRNAKILLEPKFYFDYKLGLNVMIIPQFLNPVLANHLYKLLLRIDYRTDEESMVKIMGRKFMIPRKQTAFGVKNTTYNFSGSSVKVNDWDKNYKNENTEEVAQLTRFIASRLTDKFGQKFNYALINKYLDEKSKIGYHTDDEKDLCSKSMILGISLGQERQIYFKHKTGEVIKVNLPHNSLMIMNYPTNLNWKHSIPSSKIKMKPRVSLTFRNIN
jgi:alkylated DNA repair dioxygenase AlkB